MLTERERLHWVPITDTVTLTAVHYLSRAQLRNTVYRYAQDRWTHGASQLPCHSTPRAYKVKGKLRCHSRVTQLKRQSRSRHIKHWSLAINLDVSLAHHL